MKRAAAAVCTLLAILSIPLLVTAQGYMPVAPTRPPYPMLPANPQFMPPPPSCGPGGFPCAPKRGFFSLEGAGNYQTVDADLETRGAALAGIQQIKHSYRLGGLVLGTTAAAEMTPRLSARFNFSILIPFDTVGDESYTFGGGLAGTGGRHWKVNHDWFLLDAAGAYCLSPGTAFLAGFRWDHFSATFKDPYDTVVIAGLGSDRADFTINGYIPFFGVEVNRNDRNSIRVFRIIGFPALWGDVEYNQTIGGGAFSRLRGVGNSYGGYFLEAYGEYGLRFFNGAASSAFGKFASYQTNGKLNARDLAAGGAAQSMDLRLGRISWQLGVKFELPFVCPF